MNVIKNSRWHIGPFDFCAFMSLCFFIFAHIGSLNYCSIVLEPVFRGYGIFFKFLKLFRLYRTDGYDSTNVSVESMLFYQVILLDLYYPL